MKKFIELLIMIAIIVIFAAMMAGCASTNKITTYDPVSGKILSVQEVNEAAIKQVTESTKNKTVLNFSSGWIAKLKATFTGTEDPFPTFDLEAGRVDRGTLTVPKELTKDQLEALAKVVSAAKSSSTSIGASGISATNGDASASTTTESNAAASGMNQTPAATSTGVK